MPNITLKKFNCIKVHFIVFLYFISFQIKSQSSLHQVINYPVANKIKLSEPQKASFGNLSASVTCQGEIQSVLKNDFGTGESNWGPWPSVTDFYTSYGFSNSGSLYPDRYSVVKNPYLTNQAWSKGGDHTTGDGYMLVFNVNSSPRNIFYEKTYNGLNDGCLYSFSIYAANLFSNSCVGFSVKPKVKIEIINPSNGNVIKSIESQELNLSFENELVWKEISVSFTVPQGLKNVNVRVTNAQTNTIADSNNIAFDDASLNICVPSITLSYNKVCMGENTTITGIIDNQTETQYTYRWQKFEENRWKDTDGVTLEYTTPLLYTTTKYRIRYVRAGLDIDENRGLQYSGNKEIILEVNSKPTDIVTTKTICAGENYTWPVNGVDYSTSQSGLKIKNNGCTADQVLNLIVTPKPADVITTISICSGEKYTWAANGIEYTTSQNGLKIVNSGCEADQVLNLTVTPKPADIIRTITVCEGNSYIDLHKVTNDGCTADVVYQYIEIPKPADIIRTITVCAGETHIGLHKDINDCYTADVVYQYIEIPKPEDIVTNVAICWGKTFIWPADGKEYKTNQTNLRIVNDNCTADQVLNLIITDKPKVDDVTICFEESYTWPFNGLEYKTSGFYTAILAGPQYTNSEGHIIHGNCPIIGTLILTVLPKPEDVVTNATICPGETYKWAVNDVDYTTSQIVMITNNNCTADQILNLNVIPKPNDVITTASICSGEKYIWKTNGIEYTTSQNGLKIVNSGCEADQVLNLTVTPKPADIIKNITVCERDNYIPLPKQINDGCTADVVYQYMEIPKPAAIVTTAEICSGETYKWAVNDVDYTTSQSGLTIISDDCTADQVLNLNVISKPNDVITTASICSGEKYIWETNGIEYTTSQNGLKIVNSGCEADQVLNLTVTPKPADIIKNITVCEGDNYIPLHKQINDGCTADVVYQYMEIPKPAAIVTTAEICSGQTYKWAVNGGDYTTSQSGLTIISDDCAADQVLNLNVISKPNDVITTASICSGEKYIWKTNGIEYTTSQNGLKIVNSGCEADQVLNLTVTPKPADIIKNITVCEGDNYIPLPKQINDGCTADVVYQYIEIPKPAAIVTTAEICSGQTYKWAVNGGDYTTSQSGLTIISDDCAADQVLNLNVISKPNDVITTASICSGEKYIWKTNSIEYTTSQNGLKIVNSGCEADQVLNLTVTPKPADIIKNITVCKGDNYIPLPKKINDGCTADVVYQYMEIPKPAAIVTTAEICSGETYKWAVNGGDYTTSQSGLTIIRDDCTADQILNLTVNSKPADIVTTKKICADEIYRWEANNTNYNTSGTYKIINEDCLANQVLNLTTSPLLTASLIENSLFPELCNGTQDGAFSIQILGGAAPYRIGLETIESLDTIITGTEHEFNNLGAGLYTVYIKDTQNCDTQLEITIPNGILLNPTVEVNTECIDNLPFNSVTVTVDSSMMKLDDVEYTLDDNFDNYQPSNVFTNITFGTHTVTARHTSSCQQTSLPFNIDELKPLTLKLADGGLNEIVTTVTGGLKNYQYTFNGEYYGAVDKFMIYKSGDYTITVRDQNGCESKVTKYFEYIDISIPNYFTPNGDGISDEWGPDSAANYKNLSYTIFDRYGRTIANYKLGQKWDGKYNGTELTSGDYWYVLKLNDPKDEREFIGHFTLYR